MKQSTARPFTFARMTDEHADTVRLVELLCFGHSKGTIDDLKDWLRKPSRHGTVCLHRSKVVAYVLFRIHRDELDPSNNALALHNLAGLDAVSRSTRLPIVSLVEENWLPAQLLLRANGFTCIEVKKHACPTGLDAYCFRKDPPPPANDP